MQIHPLTLTSWAYCGSSADAVAETIDDEPDTPPITHAAATAGGEGRQGATALVTHGRHGDGPGWDRHLHTAPRAGRHGHVRAHTGDGRHSRDRVREIRTGSGGFTNALRRRDEHVILREFDILTAPILGCEHGVPVHALNIGLRRGQRSAVTAEPEPPSGVV